MSVKRISEEKEVRHRIILELHSNGLSDQEIADYLNSHNIRTPTGLTYYSILVWVTRNKLKKRENRKLTNSYEMGSIKFWLKSKIYSH